MKIFFQERTVKSRYSLNGNTNPEEASHETELRF